MKKIVKYGIIVFFFLIIGFMLARTYKEFNLKKERQANIQVLPDVVFYALDGAEVNLRDYNSENGTIILFFNMVCGSCQYQIKEITQNSNKTNNYQILLITSSSSAKEVENYCMELNVFSVDNIEVLMDKDFKFEKTFPNSVAPVIYIYDRFRKLKWTHMGEIKFSAIQTALN